MTKIELLKQMLASGEFHHATYRGLDMIWEGLFIYQRDDNRFNGFKLSNLCFYKNDPQLEAAWDIVRHTGISVGSFGQG